MAIQQCSHVKSGTTVASTTMRHESIAGCSNIEFSLTTELCGVCSGIIIAMVKELEAGTPLQDAFRQALAPNS